MFKKFPEPRVICVDEIGFPEKETNEWRYSIDDIVLKIIQNPEKYSVDCVRLAKTIRRRIILEDYGEKINEER